MKETPKNSSAVVRLDHRYLWHPFTQMRDWLKREPIVIVAGQGAVLSDAKGREYLDANASIWTNLHGHRQPQIDAAIRRQLGRIAHCSALGFANEPASRLGERLMGLANPEVLFSQRARPANGPAIPGNPKLAKVFFSDDGSTAVEVALKLAYEVTRRSGRSQRPRFLSLAGAYHGDTVGAVSLGHIDLFHKTYAGLLFDSDQVMAPYCYRCPFNRAQPERGDAREYRQCRWECVDSVAKKLVVARRRGNPCAGLVFEPLMQGAAGMIPQPVGWLARAAELARADGALLIADEIMTAFGRLGTGLEDDAPSNAARRRTEARVFASHLEGVQPDFLAMAKGLAGGYLPMAATLTTPAVFDAFLGEYEEFKTFFHGHSFTGNPLGAAAALASLEILESKESLENRRRVERDLREELAGLWSLPQVGDIRQAGTVAGIELVRDWSTRQPFDLRERAGMRVCEAMAKRGVLTRPIGNVIPLLPPYCMTTRQIKRCVAALAEAIASSFGPGTVRGLGRPIKLNPSGVKNKKNTRSHNL
jgi:adenosylmethionine---8-amino-7-oxononanoate aminotransferase